MRRRCALAVCLHALSWPSRAARTYNPQAAGATITERGDLVPVRIVNPSDRQAIDKDAPHDIASAHRCSSFRLTWGPGLSVALSVTFFLVALAVSVTLDDDYHFRSTHTAATDTLAAASTVSAIDATASSGTPAQSSDPASALLARAHDCAAAGEWTCVIETINNIHSLRGDTTVTRALLEQAVIKGGWTPTQAAPRSQGGYAPHAPTTQAFPSRTSQDAKHGRRYPQRTQLTRHSPDTRATSGKDPVDPFRH